jgi:hypothetical protein
MSEFNHWFSEALIMEKRMNELQFSGLRKYHALRHLLEGQARACTRIDFPDDGTVSNMLYKKSSCLNANNVIIYKNE